MDRVLSFILDLRRSPPALFHTARTLSGSLRSPPSPRGEGFISGIAVFSYRSLPHWGRGTAPAVDRVLSYIVDLRRSFPLFFIPLSPSNLRPFGAPPSTGRRCVHTSPFPWKGLPSAARRGWLSFLRPSCLLFAFPMQGKRCYPCAIIHKQHCPYEGNQRGAGSILRLFDCHAFSGGNPLHPLSNVLPHRRRGQDRPARGIPLCGCSL